LCIVSNYVVVKVPIWAKHSKIRVIARLKNHDLDSTLRQDADVFKHATENPDHKINFTETEVFAQTDYCKPYTI